MNVLSGVLLVDKPSGLTSHDVVAKVRRHVGGAVGHAGTLDPLASGLLVLLLGEGTKFSDLILKKKKSYDVKVTLGLATDSWDTDGEILSEIDVDLSAPEVGRALEKVCQQDRYPLSRFSAVKVNGKKLYEYAREGVDVEVPLRPMNFFGLDKVQYEGKDVSFSVSCDKGGYIRSLAHCLGEEFGVGGTVSYLRRTDSFPFKVKDALSLEEVLEQDKEVLQGSTSFVSVEKLMSKYKAFTVSGRDLSLIKNGAIPNDLLRRMVFDRKEVQRSGVETYVRVLSSDDGRVASLVHLPVGRKPRVFRTFNS